MPTGWLNYCVLCNLISVVAVVWPICEKEIGGLTGWFAAPFPLFDIISLNQWVRLGGIAHFWNSTLYFRITWQKPFRSLWNLYPRFNSVEARNSTLLAKSSL